MTIFEWQYYAFSHGMVDWQSELCSHDKCAYLFKNVMGFILMKSLQRWDEISMIFDLI